MASRQETGHAKNLGNLKDLIAGVAGMGTKYVPTNAALKVANLTTQQVNAKRLHDDVDTKKRGWAIGVNGRIAEFSDTKSLATRAVNAFEAIVTNDPLAVEDLRALNKQLQGTKTKKAPTDPAAQTPKQISTSQQSYDQLKDHFKSIVTFLSQYPAYVPAEADLKVAALQAELARLDAADGAVAPLETAYKNAIIARNAAFYEPVTGLVDTSKAVKKYVKSVYGATAPEYKAVQKIAFKVVK